MLKTASSYVYYFFKYDFLNISYILKFPSTLKK